MNEANTFNCNCNNQSLDERSEQLKELAEYPKAGGSSYFDATGQRLSIY